LYCLQVPVANADCGVVCEGIKRWLHNGVMTMIETRMLRLNYGAGYWHLSYSLSLVRALQFSPVPTPAETC
jgi:hypothetical protein